MNLRLPQAILIAAVVVAIIMLLIPVPAAMSPVMMRGGAIVLVVIGMWSTGVVPPYFGALAFIPLADASAIMMLSPIIVTALSAPLLGEQVGPRRWAGVCVGCVGALLIVRPGGDLMHWAALLAALTSNRVLVTPNGPGGAR